MSDGRVFPRRLIAIIIWLWMAVGSLISADINFDVPMEPGADSEIHLSLPNGWAPQSGFLPLHVRIVNRSAAEHSWHLDLGSGTGYGIPINEIWATHSFIVPGNSTQEFFIATPVGMSGSYPRGVMWGRATGPQVKSAQFNLPLSLGSSGVLGTIVVEPALQEPMRRAFLVHLEVSNPALHRRRPTLPEQLPCVRDPDDWPADWRIWSPFLTVVLKESHWNQLDEARKRALLDWVALGGRLALVPELWHHEMRVVPHGAGEVATLPVPALDVSMGYLTERHNDGLVRGSFWDIPTRKWEAARSTGWLSTFIIVFGVVVGPVNFFLLAPAGRRHRLFATVPIISVTAIVVLGVMIAASDGFGGDGTRRVLVALFPDQNQAAVFQTQISRTGLLGRREFSLPADVLFEKTVSDDRQIGVAGELWRDGDRAYGDWFVSRTIQQHSLHRLLPTRERVEIVGHGPAGAPVVQSTIGVPLRDFTYYDDKSKYWVAEEVPSGTRVTLRAAVDAFPPQTIASLTPSRWPPDSFYALAAAGASPDLVATLPSIRWRDDVVIYTGSLVHREPAATAGSASSSQ